MRTVRTLLYALGVVALSACGGGAHGGALPPAGSDAGPRAPSGSSVAFEKDTLWVAYTEAHGVNAFSTASGGTVTPLKHLFPYRWTPNNPSIPGIVDVAIAPDGTQWILENRDFALGGSGWRLVAIAPGSTEAENMYGDDVNSPFGLALAGDGVMVGLRSPVNGAHSIVTYPYAHSFAPPLRTFQSTRQILAFASGNDGHLYVRRPHAFEVYDPTSDGSTPVRRIQTDAPQSSKFAVGPDNSIFVAEYIGRPASGQLFVNVYPPGSGTVGRRIGPIPSDFSPFGGTNVIAVDSIGRVYVATDGTIYRYGVHADGPSFKPQIVMNDPTLAHPVAMALGPNL
jgi:hypothetical protein